MSILAGFAAVAYVPQGLLDDLLDKLWSATWREFLISGSFAVPTPTGNLRLQGGLEIEKPSIVFKGAGGGYVSFHVIVHGRFSVGFNARTAAVVLRADIETQIPVVLSQLGKYFPVEVDLSGFRVAEGQVDIEWSDPGPLPSRMRTALLGDELRDWIAQTVRTQMGEKIKIAVPVADVWSQFSSAALNSQIVYVPNPQIAGVSVLEGWLAIAVDETFSDVATHGILSELEPPSDGASLIQIFFDPSVILFYLQKNVDLALKLALASQANVHVIGKPALTYGGGTNSVNAHFVGRVDAPDPLPGYFAMQGDIKVSIWVWQGNLTYSAQPHVSVDKPWYVDLGIAFLDLFGKGLADKLNEVNRQSQGANAPGWGGAAFPNMEGVTVYFQIKELELTAARVRASVAVNPYVDLALPKPPSGFNLQVSPTHFPIRHRLLKLALKSDALFGNPTYLVCLTAKRGSDGQQVLFQKLWSGVRSDQIFRAIDLWKPFNYLEDTFTVEFSVERPPSVVAERLDAKIFIEDKFDRAHPYVRWSNTHSWNDTTRFPTQSGSVERPSVVHKTDIRARCKFCDAGQSGTRFNSELLEALDTATPPKRSGFRTKLCPYCFDSLEIAQLNGHN